MYKIESDTVRWKGKPIKGAQAGAFQVLGPSIGHDGVKVYMRGKPLAGVKAESFKVLSAGYAKDAQTVFEIKETKLKPIKKADAESFEALNDYYGRAAGKIYCRGKLLRLRKGTSADDFRVLGYVYASDGKGLYFNSEMLKPPPHIDLDASALRLTWFGDNAINRPPLAITDGSKCWASTDSYENLWVECQGADFETFSPLPNLDIYAQNACFFRDKEHVWFEGARLDGVSARKARRFGPSLVSDGERLWAGALQTDARAESSFYITDYFPADPKQMAGDLVHHGDRIIVYSAKHGQQIVAQKSDMPQGVPEDCLHTALHDVFSTMFAVFSNLLPLVFSGGDIERWLDGNVENVPSAPAFRATLSDTGEVVLTLEDGTVFRQPISCWYTLGCHVWCHLQGRPLSLLPFPDIGSVSADSDAIHLQLIARHSRAMRWLASYVFTQGHEEDARLLAHMCFYKSRHRNDLSVDTVQQLVWLPPELMREFGYFPAHAEFASTTNLAVARLIVNDKWLAAENFKDRLDVINTLHGALLDTNKAKHFFEDIIPAVIARYFEEPIGGVREQLAMVLEAALVRGQVDCEVRQTYLHDVMLPVIMFCIEQGINVRFNRARQAEALWALGRDEEAETVAQMLIADIGEDHPMPGVYHNRHTYRTPRLWFLRGKIDIAYREGGADEHKARLRTLEDEYQALAKQYGPAMQNWPEKKNMPNARPGMFLS